MTTTGLGPRILRQGSDKVLGVLLRPNQDQTRRYQIKGSASVSLGSCGGGLMWKGNTSLRVIVI